MWGGGIPPSSWLGGGWPPCRVQVGVPLQRSRWGGAVGVRQVCPPPGQIPGWGGTPQPGQIPGWGGEAGQVLPWLGQIPGRWGGYPPGQVRYQDGGSDPRTGGAEWVPPWPGQISGWGVRSQDWGCRVGTPLARSDIRMGGQIPGLGGQGGYPSPWPGQIQDGGWVRSQDGGGYPLLEQHSVYLLHGGRYASCVHAGGLSCFTLLLPTFQRNGEGTVFTGVCLLTPIGVPHVHPIILPSIGPIPFPGGTPIHSLISSPWLGDTPAKSGLDGIPPLPGRQSGTASTCYTAGSMPVSFTQEDFLSFFSFFFLPGVY